MIELDVNEITVPSTRQRQEFDEDSIRKLGESIEKHGLFNAIVVRPRRPDEDLDEGKWVLMQGERRLRAIKDYVWGMGGILRYGTVSFQEGKVPALRYGDLDPLQAEEAELEENINRTDLSWQEQAAAHARLALLRQRQASTAGADAPTVADIALEIRGAGSNPVWSHEITRREILIARYLKDPEIAAAKTLDEGWKALVIREQRKTNAALAESIGRVFTASVHELYHTDCLNWMGAYQGEGFDVICTDPPYGINAQDFGDAGGRLGRQTHEYNDSYASWKNLLWRCADLWFKLTKPQAHIYVCCDVDNFAELKGLMTSAHWHVHRTPIINHKLDGNRVPWPAHGPQRRWEMILYAIKGERTVNGIFPDVIETRGDPNLGHGAQKPVALFTNLLHRSARPGDSVFDPFMGTGSALLASHELKCKFTGIDSDPVSYGIALNRLQNLKVPQVR